MEDKSTKIESEKTWSGFWSGLILFFIGFLVIVSSQIGSTILLAVQEARQTGAQVSEDRIVELASDGDAIGISFLIALPILVAILAFVIKVRRKQAFFKFLGFTTVRPSGYVRWLSWSAGLLLIFAGIDWIFDRPFAPDSMIEMYATAEDLWIFYLSVTLIGPLFEELLYRGYILRVWSQSKLGQAAATIILSALWAGTHVQYGGVDMAYVFVLGLLLCASRLATRSLLPALAIHVLWNTIALGAVMAYFS